jgi:hypothetical protein
MARWIPTAVALFLAGWAAPACAEDAPPLATPARAAANGDRAPRILAGAGLGLAGGIAGFALGFWSTDILTSGGTGDDCGDSCGIDRLGWDVIGGVIGATAGLSLGTYAGSEWVGGDGSLGWTFVGGGLGSVAALGLAVAEARGDAPGALIAVTLIAPPLVGAALGYELSSGKPNARSRGAAAALDRHGVSARLGVVPLVRGAELGASGTF